MYFFSLTGKADKELQKLPVNVQKQIIAKIKFFISSETPLVFAKRLKDSNLGSYRFRIGTYRIIFDMENEEIVILSIGHRKEIYK